jgi:hypothetical protein
MIEEPVPTMPLMVPATSPIARTKRKSKGLVSGKLGGALIRRHHGAKKHCTRVTFVWYQKTLNILEFGLPPGVKSDPAEASPMLKLPPPVWALAVC